VLDVNVWTSRLIGRDRELAALGSLLDEAGCRWRDAAADGRARRRQDGIAGRGGGDGLDRRFEVIRGGGVEYETDVSFAGLHQLVGPLSGDLRRLPRSSRVAMEVALGIGSGRPRSAWRC
jgi:hypothetical protein